LLVSLYLVYRSNIEYMTFEMQTAQYYITKQNHAFSSPSQGVKSKSIFRNLNDKPLSHNLNIIFSYVYTRTNKIKNPYRQSSLQYTEIHSVECNTSYGYIGWDTWQGK
jgi:hypothetical protein